MAQDVGIVSKYCSLIPILFGWFFLGMVREKIGERGAQWEDVWSVKYESTEPCCSQKTNSVL